MLTGEKRPLWQLFIGGFFCGLFVISVVSADDQPQWGQRHTRNMVSAETDLPETFDPASGKNIKWVVPLGTETYSTPIISGGKVLIGTNNGNPRDPRHKGDRGILLCLDEKDGSFCWQLVVPKVGGDPYLDWPHAGIVSSPTVEGDRVYVVSNRGEVVCLDLNGQTNGNDGPYRDEGRYMAPKDSEPMEVTKTDADIVWLFDIPAEVKTHQHDAAHSSILLHGQFLYINTSNGIDSNHRYVPAPDAPSIIVLDKTTGRLAAQDNERIGPRIFHNTWSSPALGDVNGLTLVFFGGGDGVCYAFEALRLAPSSGPVEKLRNIWRFDCDPNAPKENVHQYIRNRSESPSNIKSMPVFYKNRVYVTVGGDIWWGKNQAWLKCIDATPVSVFDRRHGGNITNSGEVWSYPLEQHSCSTPSIYNGLVFVADCKGLVHCVDADTGRPYWTHQTNREIWGSTLAADGKVYVGTRGGDFFVFAASRDKRVISSIELDSSTASTPVAANGVLYIATLKKLYAVKNSAK